MEYLYTAWFQNQDREPIDQDYEWPACFLVSAESEAEARSWGNHLAIQYSSNNSSEVFLKSSAKLTKEDNIDLPKVRFGIEASEAYIGW